MGLCASVSPFHQLLQHTPISPAYTYTFMCVCMSITHSSTSHLLQQRDVRGELLLQLRVLHRVPPIFDHHRLTPVI